ncbi:DUF2281 domain-containing protein [Cytobacillus sp. Hz8]|uniref:DUF2281 domain-containing protein n=1 Tax=Cytobacillus sp. Hz8 TaxID=3347168 RepID=UPI0035DE5D15
MDEIREKLIQMINEIPVSDLPQLLETAEYLRDHHGKSFKEMLMENEKKMDLWDNDIDDEIYMYV